MTLLDPRFAKVVALMRSTQHAGEQMAARSRAEAMAAAAGTMFQEALAIEQASRPEGFLDRFDDRMEAAHSG